MLYLYYNIKTKEMKNLITLELTPRQTLKLYRAFISTVKPDDVISTLESKLWDSKNKANNIILKKK